MTIILNQIQCNKCLSIVISRHRHDFVRCACGAVAADGGKEYLRRVGNMEDYTDLSIMEDDELCACGHPIDKGKCINRFCEEDHDG